MVDTRTATYRLVQLRTGRDPQELVRELYVERRLSDREIAEAVGVDRVTVNKWRAAWGIRREDRPEPTELIA